MNLSKNALYQADIDLENFEKKFFMAYQKQNFLKKYSNYIKSFKHEKHKNDTQLSN